MQSSSQIITTNKPTPNVITGRTPFLSPNQQCQSTEKSCFCIDHTDIREDVKALCTSGREDVK